MSHWSHLWERDELDNVVCLDCGVVRNEHRLSWRRCVALPEGETRGMRFEQVLPLMRKGEDGEPGGVFTRLAFADQIALIGINTATRHHRDTDSVEYFFCKMAKRYGINELMQGGVWVPTQADLLASDWVEVDQA